MRMQVGSPAMWVFLMCYIFLNIITSQNNGFVESKILSKLEDVEIMKKLKTINKPAVKIIKTIDGEQYGCVDFFKQPAFDHPSMKNHKYHYKMRPIWYSEGMTEKTANNSENKFGYLWENGVGCPIGTVPIKRVTKEDLVSLDSFEDNYKPRGSWNTTTYVPNNVVHYDQHHYAVGRTKNIGVMYNGATMDLCVTAPKVKSPQYSASRLHIQLGQDFIQAGLTVNPSLYKDHKPRTFVYTKAGGKSCYNSQCDVGMISVRKDFPLGLEMKQVSTWGADRSSYAIFGVIKDQVNGNWWLQFGGNAEQIGFWPSHKFHQNSGNLVEWGGEVYSAKMPSPEMGFGHLLVKDLRYDAYIKRISVLDGNNNVDRNVNQIETFSDDTRGYEVRNLLLRSKDVGRIVLYGGPGNI